MRHLKLLAKILISFLLIWMAFRSVDIVSVSRKLESVRLDWLAGAVILFALQIVVLSVRWAIVTNILGCNIGYRPATRITFIAQFFNQALPSTVGGDAIRVWLASQEGATLRQAAHGVLADRAVATAMLLLFVLAGLPFQHTILAPSTTRQIVDLIAIVALAGFVASLAVGGLLKQRWGRFRLIAEIGDIALAIRRVLSNRTQSVPVLLLSALNHTLSIVGMLVLAFALKVHADWLDFFVLVPFVLLLSMIPISIGGWGLREGIMIAAFGYVGVSSENALSMSLLFGLLTMAISLPGGVLWLMQKTGASTISAPPEDTLVGY